MQELSPTDEEIELLKNFRPDLLGYERSMQEDVSLGGRITLNQKIKNRAKRDRKRKKLANKSKKRNRKK